MRTATATVQSEIRRARVFLGFLREAESPADQIRLHGLGVAWPLDRNSTERASLLEYFEGLQKFRVESK